MVMMVTIHCFVRGGHHIRHASLLLCWRRVLGRGRSWALLGGLLLQLLVVQPLLADSGDGGGAHLRLDGGGAGDEGVAMAWSFHRIVDGDGGDLSRLVAGVVARVQHRGGCGHRVLAHLGLKTFLLKRGQVI